VARCDVVDNVLGRIARTAVAAPGIDALVAGAVGQIRVDGNRCFGIGPDRSSGEVTAIHVLPPFDRAVIDHNHVDRVTGDAQTPSPAAWRAIDIAPLSLAVAGNLAAVTYFLVGETAFLLTATRAIALPPRRPDVSICGNQLRGHLTAVPLNRCVSVDHCLFAENRCETIGDKGAVPTLGEITARTVTVSNNRLVGQSDLHTLNLQALSKQVIVMGNTSTGPINIQTGVPVPNDITLTNIFGV
jgi:hypothetical protein